jgi:hypothetical protein
VVKVAWPRPWGFVTVNVRTSPCDTGQFISFAGAVLGKKVRRLTSFSGDRTFEVL